ncbi:DsbA family protein [Marivibrio halodurans]|uniref:DsbA family protein n=1 Tax=Marivibrio halodurans TaxID=2039722 RepID=A0A8J7S6Q2_9PROT|nr:DsbA family protein [Marivibrio halodurans]MBP5856597.1 DsbA family protein [Marivibrio halodurans]
MTASPTITRRRFHGLAVAAAGLAAVPFLGTGRALADLPSIEEMMAQRVMGDPDAPVTIHEYASLTCPHCKEFHDDTLPQVKEAYIDPGKAKLVMHEFPLDGAAAAGSMMARCAPKERYFPIISTLFDKQQDWARSENVLDALSQVGRFAGMSQETLQACFENEALFNAIRDARNEAAEMNDINSTPTFLIGETKIVGAQPFETFAEAIDSALG